MQNESTTAEDELAKAAHSGAVAGEVGEVATQEERPQPVADGQVPGQVIAPSPGPEAAAPAWPSVAPGEQTPASGQELPPLPK